MPTASVSWPKYSTNVRIKRARRHLISAVLTALDRISPAMAENAVKSLFFRPRSSPIQPKGQQLLDQARPFALEVNGQSVAAWQWGQGPAVLLVHGWGSRGVRLGEFVPPLLARGRSVIAFDGPGHGQSEGRTSSYFEMIDTISDFIDPASGYNITGIIGHSFGAGSVVRALAGQPSACPAVALIAPTLKFHRLLVRTFEQCGIPRHLLDRIIGRFEARFGYCFLEDDPWRHLDRLVGDVVIVHDREYRVVDFGDTDELVGENSQLRLHATTGLGHRRILADSAVVASIVDHVCTVEADGGTV